MLTLLTLADVGAVSPDTLTPWKEELLWRLYVHAYNRLTLGYADERHQFGQAIADFQGIQFMLADMAMQTEAARTMVYQAAAKADREDEDLTFFGAASKCFASDVAMKVTTDAVQLLGGYGYVREFPLERMMRDAKITQIYEGTNQILRVVMARQLRQQHTRN
jgi:alkylation response protein AidB-like acyl-CoA dehydrogenase